MKPATVHYLLLQKSTGRFMLVVWDEKYSGGNEKVTINFDNTFKSVKIYDPTYSSSEIETLDNDQLCTLINVYISICFGVAEDRLLSINLGIV